MKRYVKRYCALCNCDHTQIDNGDGTYTTHSSTDKELIKRQKAEGKAKSNPINDLFRRRTR